MCVFRRPSAGLHVPSCLPRVLSPLRGSVTRGYEPSSLRDFKTEMRFTAAHRAFPTIWLPWSSGQLPYPVFLRPAAIPLMVAPSA